MKKTSKKERQKLHLLNCLWLKCTFCIILALRRCLKVRNWIFRRPRVCEQVNKWFRRGDRLPRFAHIAEILQFRGWLLSLKFIHSNQNQMHLSGRRHWMFCKNFGRMLPEVNTLGWYQGYIIHQQKHLSDFLSKKNKERKLTDTDLKVDRHDWM